MKGVKAIYFVAALVVLSACGKKEQGLREQFLEMDSVLSEQYANIQVMSKKIQEMTYKPLIQRLKDYLISLACVAVLLLFVNMGIGIHGNLDAGMAELGLYVLEVKDMGAFHPAGHIVPEHMERGVNA